MITRGNQEERKNLNNKLNLRGQEGDPFQQVILVNRFDSVLHKSHVMPQSTSPFIETCPLTSENHGIPDDLDVPAGNDHYFNEKRLIKASPCLNNQVRHGVAIRSINLQINSEP